MNRLSTMLSSAITTSSASQWKASALRVKAADQDPQHHQRRVDHRRAFRVEVQRLRLLFADQPGQELLDAQERDDRVRQPDEKHDPECCPDQEVRDARELQAVGTQRRIGGALDVGHRQADRDDIQQQLDGTDCTELAAQNRAGTRHPAPKHQAVVHQVDEGRAGHDPGEDPHTLGSGRCRKGPRISGLVGHRYVPVAPPPARKPALAAFPRKSRVSLQRPAAHLRGKSCDVHPRSRIPICLAAPSRRKLAAMTAMDIPANSGASSRFGTRRAVCGSIGTKCCTCLRWCLSVQTPLRAGQRQGATRTASGRTSAASWTPATRSGSAPRCLAV